MDKVVNFFEFHNRNKNIKYVLFEFYGGIISRKCSLKYMKKLWASRLCVSMGLSVSPKEVYRIRIESEAYLNKTFEITKRHIYNYQDLCKEIYERLINSNQMLGNCRITELEFYEKCLLLEIQIEKSMCKLNNDTIKGINYLLNKDVKIVCVVNSHLSKENILDILKYHGLSNYFNHIQVSGELIEFKEDRSLCKHLLMELDIDSSQVLVIRDENSINCSYAKSKGIPTLFIKNNVKNKIKDEKELTKKLWKLSNQGRKENIPYVNYVFSLYLFISKLYIQLKKDNVKNILFNSREGEYLIKLFKIYQHFFDDETNPINPHYFFTSRKATFLPSLSNLKNEDFDRLFCTYSNISIANFLESIGFSEFELSLLKKSINYDFYEIIIDFPNSKQFLYLVNNQQFIEIFEEKRSSQKRNLHKYISFFNKNYKDDGLAIVDVGWKGTIQDNISASFSENIDIKGYYLGLRGIRRNENKKGILFDEFPYKSRNFNLWFYQNTFYERILTASHESVNSYVIDEKNNVIPKFDATRDDKLNYEMIFPLQSTMLKYFEDICHIFKDQYILPEEIVEIFEKIHYRECLLISKKHINFQRFLMKNHYDNFGQYTYADNETDKNALNEIKTIINNIRLEGLNLTPLSIYTLSKKLASCNLGWLNNVVYFVVTKTFVRRFFHVENNNKV